MIDNKTQKKKLSDLPNIGITLSNRLQRIGVRKEHDLRLIGSKKLIIKLATEDKKGVCLNMLYALEGAIQGVRWHGLPKEVKIELKEFYKHLKV